LILVGFEDAATVRFSRDLKDTASNEEIPSESDPIGSNVRSLENGGNETDSSNASSEIDHETEVAIRSLLRDTFHELFEVEDEDTSSQSK